jgi:2-methylisocitrate lyase-like PEP mutase family enzyme
LGQRGGSELVSSRPVARPPGLEGWIGGRPAALETLRVLVAQPLGSRVADLERRTGDAMQVVRTLNELQNAGLVKIHVEQATHELIAKVEESNLDELKRLLGRVS